MEWKIQMQKTPTSRRDMSYRPSSRWNGREKFAIPRSEDEPDDEAGGAIGKKVKAGITIGDAKHRRTCND